MNTRPKENNTDSRQNMKTLKKKEIFQCDICDKEFAHLSRLKLHIETKHVCRRYECSECGKDFCQKIALKVHFRAKHDEAFYTGSSTTNPAKVKAYYTWN